MGAMASVFPLSSVTTVPSVTVSRPKPLVRDREARVARQRGRQRIEAEWQRDREEAARQRASGRTRRRLIDGRLVGEGHQRADHPPRHSGQPMPPKFWDQMVGRCQLVAAQLVTAPLAELMA